MIASSESLISSNNVYINLKNNIDEFKKEALVINYAKCYLLNNKKLDSFTVSGIDVDVYGDDEVYYLDYDNVELKLETEEGVILDYSTN